MAIVFDKFDAAIVALESAAQAIEAALAAAGSSPADQAHVDASTVSVQAVVDALNAAVAPKV